DGAAPPPAPDPPSDAGVWDALAQCESGGNWSINTGNGYYGGLQFDKGTWDAYGGQQYADYPHQASKSQQIATAERLYADRGDSPWPSCGFHLYD
ncbi:MAG: transglycosylase family protein, partial [Geodermatophilaceae bacterium]|nr:transglycosylase family protein [Geodermatophilaceae bacterium]